MDCLRAVAEREGLLVAIEAAHAFAGACDWGREQVAAGRDASELVLLICCSGARRQGHGHRRPLVRPAGRRMTDADDDGGAARLEQVFRDARAEGRAALVGYLPAGFPDASTSRDALRAMVDAGVDVLEIGLPYSDPVLDGPVIADAVHRALLGGTTTDDVLALVADVAPAGAPVLVMTYWNPVLAHGVDRFAQQLDDAGGAGCVLPDLPVEEAVAWADAADVRGLAKVHLVAPSTPPDRVARVTAACSGFVYAAAVMGVTGARAAVGEAAAAVVDRVRGATDLPVAVGLGVSTGAQAAEVAAYADGVVVGSAFVRCLLDAADPRSGVRAVGELAAQLARGCRGG